MNNLKVLMVTTSYCVANETLPTQGYGSKSWPGLITYS